MASVDGGATPNLGAYGSWISGIKKDGELVAFGAGDVPLSPRMYFRMRGWNTNTLQYEIWTSADEPDTTPPVGPCVNIQIQVVWD